MKESELVKRYKNYESAKEGGVAASDWLKEQPLGLAKDLRPLAERGLLHAQQLLSLCYAYGHGVANDWAECFRWTLGAAEGGILPAMSNVGQMYLQGRGVPQSYREAKKWFEEAAAQRDTTALVQLANMKMQGLYFRKDPVSALEMYKEAAELGDADAQYVLAVLFSGSDVVDRDVSQIVYWAVRAIAQDHSATRAWLAGLGIQIERKDALAVIAEQESAETAWEEDLRSTTSELINNFTRLGAQLFLAVQPDDE